MHFSVNKLMLKKWIYLVTILSTVCQHAVVAQSTDSLAVQSELKQKPYGVFSMFKGKPGKAALYSLILPGSGQLYNKKYWKVPIFVGAEVGTIALLINNISVYNAWDAGYKSMANGANEFQGITNIASVKTIRDNKRQSKDYAWIAVIAVHIISAADAFVDRHLIEFNIEDDIELGINPTAPTPGLSVVLSF
jgi:hypothetical protein